MILNVIVIQWLNIQLLYILSCLGDVQSPKRRRSTPKYLVLGLRLNIKQWHLQLVNFSRFELFLDHTMSITRNPCNYFVIIRDLSILPGNLASHEHTKHIDIDCHFIHEHLKLGDIAATHVSTCIRLVDIFTKALEWDRFSFLLSKLGILGIQLKLEGEYQLSFEELKLFHSQNSY